ncbi:MAG: serine O-acetyltransferase [Verrucomicrobiales bacterium]|jgi:serine O-acetyltransferase
MDDCPKKRLAEDLVASYHEVGGINRIDCTNLPSKRTVASLCEELLALLFPGYHDEEPIHDDDIDEITARRINGLVDRFAPEVAKSLRYDEQRGGEHAEMPEEMVCGFLQQLPEIRRVLKTDVEAAYEGDPAATNNEVIILSYPAIEAIAIQRLAHVLYKKSLPLLPRMMTEWAHSRTGIDIHPGAAIGTHFFIDHGTGVVIGETCTIGNHVKLYHGVTLGALSFPKDAEGRVVKGNKRHPDVENWVTIYPNATVLGGETRLSDRSTIGANVFLRRSVPADTLVTTEGAALRFLNKKTGLEIGVLDPDSEVMI